MPLARLALLAGIAATATNVGWMVAVGRAESGVARLPSGRTVSRWAFVLRTAVARREPRLGSARVATLATSTPEGTTNLVSVLGQARDHAGRLWDRIRLSVLPNGTTGWVLRDALGAFHLVRMHLVVDTRALTASLYRNGSLVFRTPVGVGRSRWPTPTGEFYVRDLVTGFDDPFYGPVAFGTSARSAALPGWPGGGYIGIHGTDAPNLLPGRVSHGCVRVRNDAILKLVKLMPVGTPLTIR